MKEDQEFRKGKKLKYLAYLIKYLFIKYPWLWLLILFILPLVVGRIAYDLLTNAEYAGNSYQKEFLEPVNVPEETIRTISTNNSNNSNIANSNSQELPLWLMLAIAFCCGSGCLVIFIILHNSQPIRKTGKRMQKRE